MPERSNRRPNLSVAYVGAAIGVVYLLIGVANGQTGFGIAGLAIMLGYAGLMYGLRRRSEPAELLSGNINDERQQLVTLRSQAAAGQILLVVLVVGFLACLVTQSQYTPVFAGLGAVGGVSFVLSVVWFSRRG